MNKNKTILIVILLAVGIFLLYHFGVFQMFSLSPVTIDPSTCQGLTLVAEKSILSSEVSNPCFPYNGEYKTIEIFYNGQTGAYLNTLSGTELVWGNPDGISTLVRCYKCSSAQIISGSPTTHVLTDDVIPNPLQQSSAFATVCQVGQCMSGWECKISSGGSYYEYNSCGGAPANPPRFCGNSILENGETSSNCCKDAGCQDGFECKSNSCTLIQSPQTCNNNNICDYGENINNCPNDCPIGPHCGDGTCGNDENQVNCCTDCKCPASQQCLQNSCSQTSYQCGDGTCNSGETCQSCPYDCGQCSCQEGQIEYIDCGEGWKSNQWAYRQCLNMEWQPISQGTPCYCVGNNYCKENYKCSNNICVPNLPTFCSSSSDCKISGFYCDTTSHKCLTCTSGIPECELSGFKCNSQTDCFGVSNNFCASWNCVLGNCVESGKRFEGCCNDVSTCVTNQTCTNNICSDIPITPKKPVSLVNIIITIGVILLIGVGGFFAYNKWFKNK